MTARSDRDLTPVSIVQKVSDASGSKYSGGGAVSSDHGPPSPISSKPAFTPTRSSAGSGGFNPLSSARARATGPKDINVDEDGWGADAPPITRTQLEKVESSYQPTKINMRALSSQDPEPFSSSNSLNFNPPKNNDVVKGGYLPVGKVDLASLRQQAQASGNVHEDRPTVVKGAYEPVGKVDIAAIRARAQKTPGGASPSAVTPAGFGSPSQDNSQAEQDRSLPDRSIPASNSERLTSLPKPKVANRFRTNSASFRETKAPSPGGSGVESKPALNPPLMGLGRTFADQGGKTPAQLWAEKKVRDQGGAIASGSSATTGSQSTSIANQSSEDGKWKSGYEGKSWTPVQTTRTSQASKGLDQQHTGPGDENSEDNAQLLGAVGAIRDHFNETTPMKTGTIGKSNPPPLQTSNKPNAGRGITNPGLPVRPSQPLEDEAEGQKMPPPPPQPPRSPTPPTPPTTDSSSPIRLAMPVGRGQRGQELEDAREEQFSPPPAMPARSMAQAIPHEDDLTDEPTGHDLARKAGEATAAATFGERKADTAKSGAEGDGRLALVQYDYEKAEDNELELKEGGYVTEIEMVDEDWWMGRNALGETGLFPSNYVGLVKSRPESSEQAVQPTEDHSATTATDHGVTATALYGYEAAEGNELTFPENAKIIGIVSTPSMLSPDTALTIF